MPLGLTIDQKKGTFTITGKLQPPTPSKGKAGNLLIVNTGGFTQTDATFDNKPVRVSLMAIVPPTNGTANGDGDGE